MAIELAAVCQTHGVDLAVDTPEKPTLCQIDETLFGQAITNLIMNALAHGGPEVSRIDISVTTKDAAIQIEVQNNGRVLDDKGFDVALARFSQVSPAVGTGLGLPIAHCPSDHRRHVRLTYLRKPSPGLCVRLALPRMQQGAPTLGLRAC